MTDVTEEAAGIISESPGTMLRRLREARGLSITEIAQRLKYGQRQIEALEHDDFEKLPGITFVRGMIRGYARLLGADPDAVLQELDRQRVRDPMAVDLRISHIPFPDGKKRTTKIYTGVSMLLIVAAAMVGYEVLPWPISSSEQSVITVARQGEKSDATAIVAIEARTGAALQAVEPAPDPVVPAPAQASAVQSAPASAAPVSQATATASVMASPGSKKIALQFDRESWVEIKQANGKTLLSQLNPGGSKQVVEGVPPFLVIIGNAPSVHLSYNDQPVDLRPHFKVDVARFTLE